MTLIENGCSRPYSLVTIILTFLSIPPCSNFLYFLVLKGTFFLGARKWALVRLITMSSKYSHITPCDQDFGISIIPSFLNFQNQVLTIVSTNIFDKNKIWPYFKIKYLPRVPLQNFIN